MSSKIPTVAIVGQTNVGKSSLFNRIFGSQEAIVAREAGTTRDNVVRKIHLNDRHTFWLVDTAGLKNPEDEFEASIQDQIEEASEAADVILVVVSGDQYPSDKDRLVAKKALRSKKPVILLINKTDLKTALPTDEFRRLGIKDIIRTSAEHNSGISEALRTITRHLPLNDKITDRDEDRLRIALIGRPNVGKSQLFNTLAGKQQAVVANIAGTTRDVNRTTVRFKQRGIELLDTAGIRRAGKQETGIEKFSVLRTLQTIDEADICCLLIDVTELGTQLDQKLAGIIKEAGKGLIIVVSKWDKIPAGDAAAGDNTAAHISRTFDFVPWAPLVYTSAVTGKNVTKIFDLAADIAMRRTQQIKTTKLNQLLQQCVSKHPPAGLKNTFPKLRYMVQTDTNPPWFVIFGSNLKLLHWSYKRFLERQLREEYDFIGTPIMFSFRQEQKPKQPRK